MSRWEDALREALRREEAPEGFAERVMARLAKKADQEVRPTWSHWKWWATAAAGVALALGTVEYRNVEGERAKDQVMLALRITNGKLRVAQAMVQRISYAPREQ